jgi:hypothetical protein
MTEAAEITVTDAEVRDWARATGRTVGIKGKVPGALRAEYVRLVAEAAADPPAAPPNAEAAPAPGAAAGGAPPRGPESAPKAPAAARDETPPRTSGSWRTRVQGWTWQQRGDGRPKRAKRSRTVRKIKDRISAERVATRLWETGGRLVQPVNLPVARCLEWQAPTAGAMLDGAVKDTWLDPIAQAVARWEGRLETLGALFGTPVIVALLQLPQNQPQRVVLVTDAQTGESHRELQAWPLGTLRHQMLLGALRECLDMNVEAQQRLPEEVKRRQLEREQRRADMDEIIGMFFAPPPGPGDAAAAAAEEEAMQAAREHLRGT